MPSRPNILLFITDDHGPWTLPCYGNTEVQSPTFDRLAEEGTLFTSAFTSTPVCSPGRACLLTGLTSSQHGVHDWIAWHDVECQERDWLGGETTIAQLLSDQGYATGLSGKWHIGRDYQTPAGYDWYFGLAMQGGHQGLSYYIYEDRARIQRGNVTKYTTDEAVGFLNRTPQDQPFFLHVAYTDTHSPYTGQDPELVAQYEACSFSDARLAPRHPWCFNEGMPDEGDIPADDIRIRHANQYAAVADIDRHMARLLKVLEDDGRLDNTLVIYTSDHGLSLGQNGFWGKGNGTRPVNLYDISIHVPLIARGPGIASGKRSDRIVNHFDTFKTICDAAGVPADRLRQDVSYPGRSWMPLTAAANAVDWEDVHCGEYGDTRVIRTPELKYVKRYPNGPHELFDLSEDPDEYENRFGQPRYEASLKDLDDRLEQFFHLHTVPGNSGLLGRELPRHNTAQKPTQKDSCEPWRDTVREQRGLQLP